MNMHLLPHFKVKKGKIFFLKNYIPKYFPEQILHNRKLAEEIGFFINLNPIGKKGCKKNILVLEPHSDDLCLSCGGTIIKKIKEGYNLYCLNIFSIATSKTFAWYPIIKIDKKYYNDIRKLEDILVIRQILKGKIRFLNYNQALLRGYKKIDEKVKKEDAQLIEEIEEKISKWISKIKPEYVFSPLGCVHVDHKILRNITLEIYKKNKKIKVFLYEEYPYTLKRRIIFENVKNIKVKPLYVDIKKEIITKAKLINIYKSQFFN